jgi:hypothetical protein
MGWEQHGTVTIASGPPGTLGATVGLDCGAASAVAAFAEKARVEVAADGLRVSVLRNGAAGATIGYVGAIRAGADRTSEVLAELGMVPTDAGYSLPDCTGHGDSSTLGRGRGSPIATTEANGARQLPSEEVAFGTGLRGPPGVPEGARLLYVVSDLGEASSVRILGTCVEHLAGIAECGARQFGRKAALRWRNPGALGGDQVEHVELPAGVGEEQC